MKFVLKRRVTTMYVKACLFFAIVLYVAVVSESWVIVPRLETEACGPNEAYSDCVNICNDCQTRNIACSFLVCNRGCDCRPGYTRNYQRICIPENQCPPGKRSVQPIDYDNYEGKPITLRTPYSDYNELDIDDNLPGIKPERFPSGEELDKIPQEDQEKPDEEKEEVELDEEKPDEEKEELDEEKPDEEKEEELDEEKPDEEKEEEELDEEKPDEEKKEEELDEEKPDEEKEEEKLDEENPDEEKKEEENQEKIDEKKKEEEESIDDDNEEEKIPNEVDEETDANDSKNKDGIPQKGGAGFFNGGSIFNTPFFNLQKVNNYFNKISRALGHAFQKTVDQALLMNGTYSNTTEEEVDIDGKKYIITKSVLKGADNQSSMYIESLSAKPKLNYTEDIEIKNLTQT